eukprot:tig00021439_g21490.t1
MPRTTARVATRAAAGDDASATVTRCPVAAIVAIRKSTRAASRRAAERIAPWQVLHVDLETEGMVRALSRLSAKELRQFLGGEHARELAAATLKPSRCPHAARLFGLHRSTRNASRRAQERMAPRALFAAPPEPQEGFWLAYDALSLALGSYSWPPVPQRA